MTSFSLKIIALITMFLDHISYPIFGGFSYLNLIGRIAFPIFAFQISEGFIHTKNVKKYMLRLLLFAFISQIPFQLFHFKFVNPNSISNTETTPQPTSSVNSNPLPTGNEGSGSIPTPPKVSFRINPNKFG